MAQQPISLEVSAATVDEAVAQGAAQLGVPVDALDVEVLDEGSKGLFGLAGRPACVRLTLRSAAAPQEAVQAAPEPDAEEAPIVAHDTVVELLERMGIQARVHARWSDEVDDNGVRPLLVDIRGDDLSILIGRRGETLAALQYITRMIVAKELDHPVAVVIDVEGYRARRERQLRQLARRMASQAVEFGRTMTLEPMPANERRIIHLELRDREDVRTESVGEGDSRKVTIIPRK